MAAPSGSGNHHLQDYQMQLMFLEQQNKKRLMMEHQEKELRLKDRPLSRSGHPSPRSDICHGLPTPQTTSPSALLPSSRQTARISRFSFRDSTYSSASSLFFEERSISQRSSDSKLSEESMDSMTTADTFDTQYPETPGFLEDEFSDFGEDYSLHADVSKQFPRDVHETSTSVNQESTLLQAEMLKCNSHSTHAQAPTPDTNTFFCPVDRAETPSGPSSSSSILSKAIQDKQVKSQYGTDTSIKEALEFLDAERQDFGVETRQNFQEDTKNTIGSPPLWYSIRSLKNATSEQPLACDTRQSSSSSIMSSSGSQTSCCLSDNDTDWGDDESDDDTPNIMSGFGQRSIDSTGGELPVFATTPVLSKIKQELVDRIMVQFWEIFNQEKETNLYEDTILQISCFQHSQESDADAQEGRNSSQTTTSSANSGIQTNGTSSIVTQNGKRKHQDQDENENNEGENRSPKRPKNLLSPPRNISDTSKFACPYRKHNARKYCVRNWRSCALTPLETIARVKGHLYRHHRIFPCQRCKKVFKNQQEVNEHLNEAQGCILIEGVQHDGLTSEIVERLRSKKKAHREQTEEERWVEIYHILFPGEIVPSPFFEEIQEDTIQSPDSQELADYEEYCRRELPRVFRASLEEVVNKNTQPLEEQLRSQLMDLIRDAQDRVFSGYRSSSSTTTTRTPPTKSTPSSSPPTVTSSSSSQGSSASPVKSQPTIGNSADSSHNRLPAFLQPPSPQIHLQPSLDISNQTTKPSLPSRYTRSDSGYDSGSFVLPSTQPLELGEFTVNNSTSNFQAVPLPEMNKSAAGHPNSINLTQANSTGITTNGIGHLNSELLYSENNLDFSFDSVDLSKLDEDFFGNYDFSQNLDDLY